MSPETITELFSYICGQSRSFVADGTLLPVDQRCLGLYVGALLTALWLTATGIWRCGLPSRGVFLVHVAALLAAMLGGLHVIDPGPLWRFAFGQWTGHISLLWLVGATVHFRALSRPGIRADLPWRATQSAQGIAFPIGLALFAWASPVLLPLGWEIWTAAAILGVIAMAAGISTAAYAMTKFAIQTRREV